MKLTQIVDDRLANPCDCLPVAGHLGEEGYAQGAHSLKTPEGLEYDLVLTNAGEGILATGMVRAHVTGTCDRCLGDASFDLAAEVDEYYLFHEPQEPIEVGEGEDEVDYSLVADDGTIDLSEAIMGAIALETPFVVLCKEDCAGLCPECGANLNEHDCGHAAAIEARRERERLDASPFAALRELDLPEE